MPQRFVYIAIVSALALVIPAAATGGSQPLTAVVGPGFNISLNDASGNRITQLKPGTYRINVNDRSAEHNFHLSGPGVNERTDVEFVGETSWTVTVTAGTYTYVCDPHASAMRGSFTVESDQPAGPKPAAIRQLRGAITASRTIVLRYGNAAIKTVKAGTYDVLIRDSSKADRFRLRGPGVNRSTGVAFTGQVKWRVRLAKGVYRYGSATRTRTFRVT